MYSIKKVMAITLRDVVNWQTILTLKIQLNQMCKVLKVFKRGGSYKAPFKDISSQKNNFDIAKIPQPQYYNRSIHGHVQK